MKSLETIQKLSKMGKVISKILFIFSLIGIVGSIVGLICMNLNLPTISIGGITLHSILIKENISDNTIYISMMVAIILCLGEAILAKYSEHYFNRELIDGTPFNIDGANELKRIGILTICIPLVTQILTEIVNGIMKETSTLSLDCSGSILLGLMFIVLSIVCRYGAETLKN